MRFESLIDPAGLAEGLRSGACIAVDCRFDLSDPDRGRQDYLSGHIPGARYAHLDDDLSAPGTPSSGRHPLPPPAAFAAFLSRIGWVEDRLLVAFDERNNAIAARLWWLMRYFGKPAALLDGGLEAWQRAGLPLEAGMPKTKPSIPPELEPQAEMTVSADQILAADRHFTLIDARAAERYRGETEPLDARGGHIPGALNRSMGLNLDESGRFKPAERLREEFRKLVGAADPGTVVNYCGSGVTACHNLFAMERAGYAGARVYPGSWSEWLCDADRPVATGGD
jgi:thiosulfate/3-mercaptopyruvate sulfurtransferase